MKTIMKTTLIQLGLLVSLTGCSDSAQFSEQSIPAGQQDASAPTTNPDGTPTSGGITDPSSGSGGSPTVETGSTPELDGGSPTEIVKDPATAVPGGATNPTTGTPTTEAEKTAAIQKLREACDQGTKKTLKQSILFPERRGCSWGQNGNLQKLDAHLQARETQTASLNLPEKAQLCGLELGSKATTIQYDDFMILTLNDYVLLSSNSKMMENLQTAGNDASIWDFERVKNKTVDFNSPHYCLGSASSICEVPVTDTPGKFQLQIDPSSLESLADKIVGQRVLSFGLISTGDNDDVDCWHTEFSLDFTLTYVE